MTFLKFLMLLTLSLWLGGILFFSVVEAPAILASVRDRTLGGEIINQSLAKLHWIGIICGLVFLLASLLRGFFSSENHRLFPLPHIIVLAMLACTFASQHFILPAIAQLRGAQTDPAAAIHFQHLHKWSVGLEGAVLMLGFVLLYVQAGESGSHR